MLHKFLGNKTTDKIFMINAPIFSVIIGEMMWDPKDVEKQPHADMMACFTDVGDDLEALQGGQGRDIYRFFIKK